MAKIFCEKPVCSSQLKRKLKPLPRDSLLLGKYYFSGNFLSVKGMKHMNIM